MIPKPPYPLFLPPPLFPCKFPNPRPHNLLSVKTLIPSLEPVGIPKGQVLVLGFGMTGVEQGWTEGARAEAQCETLTP